MNRTPNPVIKDVLRDLRTQNPCTARVAIERMLSRGVNLTDIAKESDISVSSLQRHVNGKLPMSPKNARKLSRWSGGVISAVLMFEKEEIE